VTEPNPPHSGLQDLEMEKSVPPEVTSRELWRSRALFVLTFISVFWVYGAQWMGGSPFSDAEVAVESLKFAGGLMAILLAHEMGHYLVARMHGFALSLPYFIPFPAAFGTFGAIIRLRSLPKTRTALLEMGAAGPLAGFVVALVVLAMGLPGTVEAELPRVVMDWSADMPPPPPPEDPGWLDSILGWFMDEPVPGEMPMMILSNPPVMDFLGWLLNGQAPGRYAHLDALAMAGWVGCMLTAINLLPVGQLDGGHIFNAIWPERARQISKVGVLVAILAGFLWTGWAFWGVLLLVMRAWMSLPVPVSPGLTPRSIKVALWTALAFLLCFMPTPVELENVPFEEMDLRNLDEEPIDPLELRRWMEGGGPSEGSELESSQ
jgi:membrane-associated protease RseP (regulator of RpoE activity)